MLKPVLTAAALAIGLTAPASAATYTYSGLPFRDCAGNQGCVVLPGTAWTGSIVIDETAFRKGALLSTKVNLVFRKALRGDIYYSSFSIGRDHGLQARASSEWFSPVIQISGDMKLFLSGWTSWGQISFRTDAAGQIKNWVSYNSSASDGIGFENFESRGGRPTQPGDRQSGAWKYLSTDGPGTWVGVIEDTGYGPAAIPVPAALPLMGLALGFLGMIGRKRARSAA